MRMSLAGYAGIATVGFLIIGGENWRLLRDGSAASMRFVTLGLTARHAAAPVRTNTRSPSDYTQRFKATSDRQSGAIAKCRDGSLSFTSQYLAACYGHNGVQEWYR